MREDRVAGLTFTVRGRCQSARGVRCMVGLVALVLATPGCSANREDAPLAPATAPSAAASSAGASGAHAATQSPGSGVLRAAVSPYPKGRWRIGNWNDLQRVALWGAHILIRHRESRSGYPFSPTASIASPAPERSREEALRIAQEIARTASAAPDDFERLARERSEDLGTAARGGVLGELMASQLLPWSMVLDAFAYLNFGEVSQVVETNYGFHVFRRLPPPAEDIVTGSHVVIGHAEAAALARLAGRDLPERSREQARRLADDVFTTARENPARFAELVLQHSEHPDAPRRGDLGTWSTREPSPLGAYIEVLRHLKVGEVAPPIDTPYGYQILQRQPNSSRTEWAVAAVQLPYDATLSDDDAHSRRAILDTAKSLLREVRLQPDKFEAYQRDECCVEPIRWRDGRGIPQLANAVERLQVGELGPDPIDAGFSIFVVRRIEVPASSSPPGLVQLPSPEAPDFDFIAAYRDTAWVREQLAKVAEDARGLLATLPEPVRASFEALHEEGAGLDERSEPPQRSQAFSLMQHELEQMLGNDAYRAYRRLLDSRFEHELLTEPF